jgi:hypothetical protein
VAREVMASEGRETGKGWWMVDLMLYGCSKSRANVKRSEEVSMGYLRCHLVWLSLIGPLN